MYCAVIGDIIQSKQIKNRLEVQEKLKEVLNLINNKYKDDIASKFTITLGDEFQGLLHNPINAFEIIEEIQLLMHPTRFRFGVGLGDITTNINKNMAFGSDGPAYYLARDNINYIKEQKKKKQSLDERIMFSSNSLEDNLINIIVNYYRDIEKSWTSRQRELIIYTLKNNKTQNEVAKNFNIKQSTVSRNLESANYLKYINARVKLKEYLKSKY